ncbi:hypothetical protein BKA65DRAFT_576630 [Rhexocercosporidium sp. MPI-PUGE-AT-0058]|nr:hypothetical protein BKA65DRAFT_576630 [Rhexocercosporidium sp. MPI-PUGE-AT-0058]
MSELQQERRGIHQDPEFASHEPQTPVVANFILPLESSNLNDQCQTCSKNIRSCVKTAWAASEIDYTFSRMKLRHIQRILDEYRLRLDIWMSDCGDERGDLPNVTTGDESAIPTLLVELFQQLYQYSTVVFRGIQTIEANSRTLIESPISRASPVEVMNKAEVEILEACDSLASTLTELARLQSSIQMNSAVRLGSRSSGPEARLHTEVLNVRTAFLEQNVDNLEYSLDSAMTEDTVSQHSDDGMCPDCHLSFPRHALHLHTDFCQNPTEFESIPQPSIQNPLSLHSPKMLGSSARNPFWLLQLVLGFVFHLRSLLVKIILPFRPMISGPLDELYPSWQNIKDLTLHFILLYTQLIQLFSLPTLAVLFLAVPGVIPIINLVTFCVGTWIIMRLLNGTPTTECLVGLPDGLEPVNDEHELWFFINGVATGKNWLQSNLNLIAQTFQREVVGIHNTTYGFMFDLLECLIQRDLDYKSHDIRQGRA